MVGGRLVHDSRTCKVCVIVHRTGQRFTRGICDRCCNSLWSGYGFSHGPSKVVVQTIQEERAEKMPKAGERAEFESKHKAARLAERKAWESEFRELGILRTLEDMTEEQIVALELQYKCKVRRPGK
jgi:hypothetical protein